MVEQTQFDIPLGAIEEVVEKYWCAGLSLPEARARAIKDDMDRNGIGASQPQRIGDAV